MKLNLIFNSDIKILMNNSKFLIKRNNLPLRPNREINAIKFIIYPSAYSLQILILSRCKKFTNAIDIPSHNIENCYLVLPNKELIKMNILFYTSFLYL